MIRALRFVVAGVAVTVAFLGTWFVCEGVLGTDRGTAQALSGLAAALAAGVLFWWATLDRATVQVAFNPPLGSVAPSLGLAIESSLPVAASPVDGVTSALASVLSRPDGALPRIWNIVPRNPAFVGRGVLLDKLRGHLCRGETAVVQALHGIGGVGKTQLAIEYAYRYMREYDLAWWFAAEHVELLGDQYSALAIEAGLVGPEADTATAVRAVRRYLGTSERWLVIFDNADDPAQLRDWLPVGPGHVIITSRLAQWHEIAAPVAVDVFNRSESTEMLIARAELGNDDADCLAEALGDLPLALAQAAGLIAETGMSTSEYHAALQDSAAALLDESATSTYPVSLAAALRLSISRLGVADKAAVQLAGLCACLAAEPVPLFLFTSAPGHLMPEPLNAAAAQPVALRRIVGLIARVGLARADHAALQMHRLTKAVLSAKADDLVGADAHKTVEKLLIAAAPADTEIPGSWPVWAQLVPHILAVDPRASSSENMRSLAARMVWYMLSRGDLHAAIDFAEQFRTAWIGHRGPDDPSATWIGNHLASGYSKLGLGERALHLRQEVYTRLRSLYGNDDLRTIAVAGNLAGDLRRAGRIHEALQIDQDVLARRRKVLGDDHPETLRIENGVARDLRRLGQLEAARKIDENVLARMQRTLGEEHVYTLIAANSLAHGLRMLGDIAAAHHLDETILAKRRNLLGENHPSTLMSASNLARDLCALGQWFAARQLDEDVLARRRLTLGDDHPDTLVTARNLAADLRALGETEAAHRLELDTAERSRNAGEPSEPDGGT